MPVLHERGELLADEVRELAPRGVDEDEGLVVHVLQDVAPAHLDRLADDLLLVLVEGDEDPLLALDEPAADELRRERRLPRPGRADHDGRRLLVEPAVEEGVEAENPGANLAHACPSGGAV